MTNELDSWGLSMYGGYYAQVWIDEQWTGFHGATLRELKEQLKAVGITKLEKDRRYDN